MSFATEVKGELAGIVPARDSACLQELRGLAVGSHAVVTGPKAGGSSRLRLAPLRNQIARTAVKLARRLGAEAKATPVPGATERTLAVEMPLLPRLARWLRPDPRLPATPGDRRALLRGFFLACGSVNAPSARYHLELVPPTPAWAEALRQVLADHDIHAGVSERAHQPLLYIKEGDGVAGTLSLLGASRAVMAFESARVVREVSAQINRQLNFETANLEKVAEGASRQVAAIRRLERSGRLAQLTPALRQMAATRLAEPELSLEELALRLELSKSGANHRLRRLMREATKLDGPG
ncbi:MAG: DNA-binding protein WhiA [Candidatus Dormibacteraeota bacterium]|nr:DNA-binding protein WhiA [Candidatus Dormibacteraeota bacterium]MBO0744366.1 DNA-binding protein WhiA [Candidatus Dormibacteraeota bacterium]